MRISPVLAGVAAGAVLAVAGVAAIDLASTDAEAQGGGSVTQAQLRALEAKVTGIGQNSSAAQRIAKNLQNSVGKHVTPEGTLIGAKQPPGVIRQDRGLGGGLPTELIGDGAITSSKLAPGLLTVGPQGVPGPTASAIATNTANITLPVNSGRRVVSLTDPAGSTSSTGRVQTTFAGRLMASAVVTLQSNGAATGDVECRLWTQVEGSVFVNPLSPFGVDIPVPAAGKVTTTLVGGANRGAGSYEVFVQCFTGDANMVFDEGHMIVWATAA